VGRGGGDGGSAWGADGDLEESERGERSSEAGEGGPREADEKVNLAKRKRGKKERGKWKLSKIHQCILRQNKCAQYVHCISQFCK